MLKVDRFRPLPTDFKEKDLFRLNVGNLENHAEQRACSLKDLNYLQREREREINLLKIIY